MRNLRTLFASLVLSSFAFTTWAGSPVATTLRVMAANLSSGNNQSYDEPGIRILKGLKADVILIQEFRYKSNSEADIQHFVKQTMGENAYYFRESQPDDRIPNGVISRYPILEMGEWEDKVLGNGRGDRDFVWARLDIPGPRDLWAISVHLKASKGDSAKREAQVRHLMREIQNKIPASDYVVLGGDSNAAKKEESFFKVFSGDDKETQGYATLLSQSAFPSKYTPGIESDDKSQIATNMGNQSPYDIILADQDLNAAQSPTTFVSNSEALDFVAPTGLVFDSSVFPRLELVEPILETDSRAHGMQHLAVIKEFKIPLDSTAQLTEITK